MIDCQNTYVRGVMALDGVAAALDEAAELLERARLAGIPIIHFQHDGGEGSPYDVRAEIGQIVDKVAPRGDETVIVKQFPNGFVQTDLDGRLKALSARNLVLAEAVECSVDEEGWIQWRCMLCPRPAGAGLRAVGSRWMAEAISSRR